MFRSRNVRFKILDLKANFHFNTFFRKTAENNEDGSSMPVFMVVATKFLKLPMKILEVVLNGDTIERLSSKQDIFSAILDAQRASIIRNGLVRNTEIKEEITFNLFRANEKNPRYSLFILDMKPPVKVAGRYAAFICPLGRETEWLFSTPSGRKKLLESSKHARLAIITMNRNHQFNNLEKVTEELNDCIKSFSPPGLMGQKVRRISYSYYHKQLWLILDTFPYSWI